MNRAVDRRAGRDDSPGGPDGPPRRPARPASSDSSSPPQRGRIHAPATSPGPRTRGGPGLGPGARGAEPTGADTPSRPTPPPRRPRPRGATPSPVTRAPKRTPTSSSRSPRWPSGRSSSSSCSCSCSASSPGGRLSKALHQREEHMEHVLLDAERARNESERLLAEHRKQMAAAADQVRALIDEARRDAQATADEIIRKAQAEAEAVAGSRRARDRPRPRPGAGRDLDQDRRPGRLGRRPGPGPGAERVRPPPPGRDGDGRAAGEPGGQRGGESQRMSTDQDASAASGDGLRGRRGRGDRGPMPRRWSTPPRRGTRSRPCSTSSTRSAPTCCGAPAVRHPAGLAVRPRRGQGPHPRRDVRGAGPADGPPLPPRPQPAWPARPGRPDRPRRPGDLGPPPEPPAGHGPLGRPARRGAAGRRSATGWHDSSAATPVLTVEVDPALIGGLVVQVGRRRLRRLGPQPSRTTPSSPDRREDA